MWSEKKKKNRKENRKQFYTTNPWRYARIDRAERSRATTAVRERLGEVTVSNPDTGRTFPTPSRIVAGDSRVCQIRASCATNNSFGKLFCNQARPDGNAGDNDDDGGRTVSARRLLFFVPLISCGVQVCTTGRPARKYVRFGPGRRCRWVGNFSRAPRIKNTNNAKILFVHVHYYFSFVRFCKNFSFFFSIIRILWYHENRKGNIFFYFAGKFRWLDRTENIL